MEDGKTVLSKGAFLSIYKIPPGNVAGQKWSAISVSNLLEVCPHNRLPSPDYIMCEITVPHLVQMCSYGMLDLAQIL